MNDDNQLPQQPSGGSPPQPGVVPPQQSQPVINPQPDSPAQPAAPTMPQAQGAPGVSQTPPQQVPPSIKQPQHNASKKKMIAAIIFVLVLLVVAFGAGLALNQDSEAGDSAELAVDESSAQMINDNFADAQAKARDVARKNDINSMYQKLEEYYNENGSYPAGGFSADTFPGIDTAAFTDDNDTFIIQTTSESLTAPEVTYTPGQEPAGAQYTYAAYECSGGSCQRGG